MIKSLILRRRYPRPVTFEDLRASHREAGLRPGYLVGRTGRKFDFVQKWWAAALKEVTGAVDEVYAVVDGRELRVARVLDVVGTTGRPVVIPTAYECPVGEPIRDLMDAADRAGYWERLHEVRRDLTMRGV